MDISEYKWLGMDDAGFCWYGDSLKWSCGMYVATGELCNRVYNEPSWIKPCQLWERAYKKLNDMECSVELKEWNGYWWRLIEDNSTHATPVVNASDTHKGDDMHEYKKGGLVRHKPSGCVAVYESEDLNQRCIAVSLPENLKGSYVENVWDYEDCEPVTDKQPVDAGLYEAAKQFRKYPNHANAQHKFDIALTNSTPCKCEEDTLEDVSVPYDERGLDKNSKPNEPQGWITDRRPTEDDADEWGYVWIWTDDGPDVVDWKHVSRYIDTAWASTPLHFRTPPPEHPKCETCKHLGWSVKNAREMCTLIHCLNPTYGRKGCKYKHNKS